jgi:hypothetical protein
VAAHIIAVDLQNDFCSEGGVHYRPRSCVPFIKERLFPFVRERGYCIAEIISDYRKTEPGTKSSTCVPGQWGFESIIPSDLKHPTVWVKATPSPAWTRAGAGKKSNFQGSPIQPQRISARGSRESLERPPQVKKSS